MRLRHLALHYAPPTLSRTRENHENSAEGFHSRLVVLLTCFLSKVAKSENRKEVLLEPQNPIKQVQRGASRRRTGLQEIRPWLFHPMRGKGC